MLAYLKKPAAFLVYGLVLYFLAFQIWPDILGMTLWIVILVIPFCIGAFAQMVFDPDTKSLFWKVSLYTILATTLFLCAFVMFGIEALICVAMSLPIVVPFELLGIAVARHWLQKRVNSDDRTKLHLSLVILPLLTIPVDLSLTYPLAQQTLRSEVVINATPAEIWQQTLEIPTIQPQERIWTFSHNILRTPGPLSAELEGNVRDLHWTKGVRFQEIVTESVLHQRLAWDFHFHDMESLAAFDPHVSPNSEMLRVTDGFYALKPLADGQTLLVLETHYETQSPFNSYLELWGQVFLGDFHSAVLAVIKTRAEGGSGPIGG